MYRAGDVRIIKDPDYEGQYRVMDARPLPGDMAGWAFWPHVELPHSCDAWVIGGREQVDAMIQALTEARREAWPD